MSQGIQTPTEWSMFNIVLNHITQLSSSGDIESLLLLGISLETADIVKSLLVSDIHALGQQKVKGITVSINDDEFREYIIEQKTKVANEYFVTQLILLGAPQSMLHALHGLSDHEYRVRKRKLKTEIDKTVLASVKRGGVRMNDDVINEMMVLRCKQQSITSRNFIMIARTKGYSVREMWAAYISIEKSASEGYSPIKVLPVVG